jgi:hypothetical protein
MRFTYISLCLLVTYAFTIDDGNAQNFIGMEKDEIIQVMGEKHKSFKLNTNVVNPHYKYLKFENKISEITMLFFLSEDNRCTLVRQMCDYSNLNDVIADLNLKYTPSGKNTWFFKDGNQIYLVNLLEEEWYFTVTTKLKE